MTGAGALFRTGFRHLLRHPWQMGLSALGIALGVAVAVGMDLAIGSTREAFQLSAETVAGRATHQIVGGSDAVASESYRRLRVVLDMRNIAPVVEADVEVEEAPGRVFRLLGLDPLAEGEIRPFLAPIRDGVANLFTERSGWITREVAGESGLSVGDSLRVSVEGRTVPILLAGFLEPASEIGARALGGLLVTDISTAQMILRTEGLTRIDLRLPDGADEEAELVAARALLAPGERVVPAGARSAALLQMTRAFRINLTALSLLALLFGIFFIYNAMTFSVVQRRPLFGTLRAIGVTRGQLLVLILAEAALLGVLGAAAGTALGVALGRGLVGFVATTINDLYFAVTVRELALPATAFLKGALLGIGGAVIGALPPALEAVRTEPRGALLRSTLESRVRRSVPRLTLSGLALALLGGALLIPPGRLVLGFSGLFAIVIACALLIPSTTILLMGGLRPLAGALGPLGRMAAAGVTSSLSRTAPALAALMVAVATTVALGVMIGSFRLSVVDWLDTTLEADVYVSAPGIAASRPGGTLDPGLVRRLSEAPGVAAVATYRTLELLRAEGPVRVGVLDPAGERSRGTYRFISGDPATAWSGFETGDVLVSEPLAYREQLSVGDAITLPTDRGDREVRIAGVIRDYGPDQGVVVLHRASFDALFDDRSVESLALYAEPGADPDRLVATLRTLAADADQAIHVRSNRALKEASLAVFDRTFVITGVLRVMGFIVALVGVLAALAALQMERAREFAVLRAVGVTPGQLRLLVTGQTGLMGFAAGLLSIPVGALLAALMIHVINRRSFGWSLEMHMPPEVVWQALALSVGAALAAGILPAIRMSRVAPALALREE